MAIFDKKSKQRGKQSQAKRNKQKSWKAGAGTGVVGCCSAPVSANTKDRLPCNGDTRAPGHQHEHHHTHTHAPVNAASEGGVAAMTGAGAATGSGSIAPLPLNSRRRRAGTERRAGPGHRHSALHWTVGHG